MKNPVSGICNCPELSAHIRKLQFAKTGISDLTTSTDEKLFYLNFAYAQVGLACAKHTPTKGFLDNATQLITGVDSHIQRKHHRFAFTEADAKGMLSRKHFVGVYGNAKYSYFYQENKS